MCVCVFMYEYFIFFFAYALASSLGTCKHFYILITIKRVCISHFYLMISQSGLDNTPCMDAATKPHGYHRIICMNMNIKHQEIN